MPFADPDGRGNADRHDTGSAGRKACDSSGTDFVCCAGCCSDDDVLCQHNLWQLCILCGFVCLRFAAENYDYTIVHGYGIVGDQITPLLKSCVDKALTLYRKSGKLLVLQPGNLLVHSHRRCIFVFAWKGSLFSAFVIQPIPLAARTTYTVMLPAQQGFVDKLAAEEKEKIFCGAKNAILPAGNVI